MTSGGALGELGMGGTHQPPGHFDRAWLRIIFHQTLLCFTHHTNTLRYPTAPPTTGLVLWGLITRQRIIFIFRSTTFTKTKADNLIAAVSSTLPPLPITIWGPISLHRCTIFLSHGGQLVAPRSRSRRLFGRSFGLPSLATMGAVGAARTTNRRIGSLRHSA